MDVNKFLTVIFLLITSYCPSNNPSANPLPNPSQMAGKIKCHHLMNQGTY